MTQTTILAAGQTAGDATEVTVTASAPATLSIRSATAGQLIPRNIGIPIRLKVGADKQTKAVLTALESSIQVVAPGAYVASREDISAYGVDIEVLLDQ